MKAALATAVLLLLSFVAAFAQDSQNPGQYVIRTEDVLRIQVYGEQQVNVEIPVDEQGNISAPFVGTLHAEGKTTAELEQELTIAYRERLRLRDPKVSVTFSRFRTYSVSIGGAVQKPGLYPFRQGDTILTLLHLAGDPIPTGVSVVSADLRRAWLKHKNSEERVPIDLYALLYRGDLSQNYTLQDGDQLQVPESPKNNVQVMGWIQRPNQYAYRDGMTLADVLAAAGGEIPRRSRMSRITVTREIPGAPGNYQRIQADFVRFLSKGDVAQNITLQPGDFVYVPANNTPDINEIANVVNAVFGIDRILRDGLFGFRVFR